jgi:hypothetical protein
MPSQNQIDQPRTSSARPWDLTYRTKQANDRAKADAEHRNELLQDAAEQLPEALPLVREIPHLRWLAEQAHDRLDGPVNDAINAILDRLDALEEKINTEKRTSV